MVTTTRRSLSISSTSASKFTVLPSTLVTVTVTPSSSDPAVSVQRIVVPFLPSRSPGQEMSSGAVPTLASRIVEILSSRSACFTVGVESPQPASATSAIRATAGLSAREMFTTR